MDLLPLLERKQSGLELRQVHGLRPRPRSVLSHPGMRSPTIYYPHSMSCIYTEYSLPIRITESRRVDVRPETCFNFSCPLTPLIFAYPSGSLTFVSFFLPSVAPIAGIRIPSVHLSSETQTRFLSVSLHSFYFLCLSFNHDSDDSSISALVEFFLLFGSVY